MIIITSKRAGFRRCGVAHPAEPTEYPDDAFSRDQLKAMHDEPMLMVFEAYEAEADLTNKPVPAADMIALIKEASAEELEHMAEGETRKKVLDAIAARGKELEA